jgi:glucose/arabinose dehydrogenase
MLPARLAALAAVAIAATAASALGPAAGAAHAQAQPRVSTVAGGLNVPWEIAFLPDRRALISERGGTVRLLSSKGRLQRRAVGRVPVRAVGEGGLLGLAVDPGFRTNRFVYAYRTTARGNEVVRLRFRGGRLRVVRRVLTGIRAGATHNGGRIRFGPDRRLYVTTGDAGDPELSQRAGRNGKVLRLSLARARGAGGAPQTVTTGHRNPQGLAWQPGSGRLFATEHGPRGNDEVNHLVAGRNYGWPRVTGRDHGAFAAPVAVFTPSIAPSGATFVTGANAWRGSLVFGGLVGEQIRRLRLDGTRVTGSTALFRGRFGRIRTVVEGPGGALYALTNNRDGRGDPRRGDDRILRIVPPRR